MYRPILQLVAALGCSQHNPVPLPDSDADGVPDAEDRCPDADDTQDADEDGVPDACDTCPDDPLNNEDRDTICGSDDICPDGDDRIDSDGDGVPNQCDQCPDEDDFGPDADGDTVPDLCDICPADNPDDTDGDGVCDSDDVCEGLNDATSEDTDGDGVCDAVDPCPDDANDDSDNDGSCDSDDTCQCSDDNIDGDGDGYPDGCDPCLNDPANACGRLCTMMMDDAWAIYGEQASPQDHYGQYGITYDNVAGYGLIGGMGNGDPGNWDIDGTNGTAAWGIWPGAHSIGFSLPVTDVELDFLRGHNDYTLTVDAYLGGVFQDSTVVNPTGAFDFETATFGGPLDEVRFDSTSYFGVDNVRYFGALICP